MLGVWDASWCRYCICDAVMLDARYLRHRYVGRYVWDADLWDAVFKTLICWTLFWKAVLEALCLRRWFVGRCLLKTLVCGSHAHLTGSHAIRPEDQYIHVLLFSLKTTGSSCLLCSLSQNRTNFLLSVWFCPSPLVFHNNPWQNINWKHYNFFPHANCDHWILLFAFWDIFFQTSTFVIPWFSTFGKKHVIPTDLSIRGREDFI